MQHSKFRFKIIITIILFSAILIRLFIMRLVNNRFERSMNYDRNLAYAKYYLEEDGYIYKYRPIGFFNNDGFASVMLIDDQNLYMDDKGNLTSNGLQITLYVWPMRKKMGLDFYEKTLDTETSMQIYIDYELNYITDELNNYEIESINSLLYTNRERINALIERANTKWNIKELIK